MNVPLILVTGATGKVGSAVVEQLRAKDARVRALVHGKDSRSARLAALGAELVVGDMFDPLDVERALREVSRLAYIAPWHPHLLDSAVAFATAAPRAGVEAIVSLTQWLASPNHPALTTRQSWLAERAFAQIAGTSHVTVRPGFFADNYLAVLPLAANLGLFPFPLGGRRNAPPSNEDIARVIVGALLDPAAHAGRAYRPTGPTLLGGEDMARILGVVLRRRVRHVEVPVRMMMKAVRAQRTVPTFMQSQLHHFLTDSGTGVWEHGGPTTHVKDLSGHEPEDFETIARRYARLPANRRSARNLTRVLWDFFRTPFVSGLSVERFERAQLHPRLARVEWSGRSPTWAAEHGASAARVEV